MRRSAGPRRTLTSPAQLVRRRTLASRAAIPSAFTTPSFSSPASRWVRHIPSSTPDPANNFDGLVGGGGDVTGVNQLTYTADLGNGVSASISAQDQVAYYTSNLWNTSGATA